MKKPFSLKIYSFLTFLFLPFIAVYLAFRKSKGKEDLSRFCERLGKSKTPRPEGKLVLIHGASVGETLSILPLVDLILKTYPDWNVLVTSGTITSARLMEQRLPKPAFHQYVPIDCPEYTQAFVNHFKPDLALWVESEFWPNLLFEIKAHGTPLLLINGRISDRSFKRWQKFKRLSADLQSLFTLSFGQTQVDADRLAVLGANKTACVGNIKFAQPILPCDPDCLKTLTQQINSRPAWTAGSTHAGEEEMIADIHLSLKQKFPNLITILAPRHPNRCEKIALMLGNKGLNVAIRSKSDPISNQTDIYLADTIGEMGLFYRLSPIAFVGGSLIPFGGQNMIEPARLEKAVLTGPYIHNFKEIVANATNEKALIVVSNSDELCVQLNDLLSNKKVLATYQKNAHTFAQAQSDVLDHLKTSLEPFFNLDGGK